LIPTVYQSVLTEVMAASWNCSSSAENVTLQVVGMCES